MDNSIVVPNREYSSEEFRGIKRSNASEPKNPVFLTIEQLYKRLETSCRQRQYIFEESDED